MISGRRSLTTVCTDEAGTRLATVGCSRSSIQLETRLAHDRRPLVALLARCLLRRTVRCAEQHWYLQLPNDQFASSKNRLGSHTWRMERALIDAIAS